MQIVMIFTRAPTVIPRSLATRNLGPYVWQKDEDEILHFVQEDTRTIDIVV
jgi:hypothetical protein